MGWQFVLAFAVWTDTTCGVSAAAGKRSSAARLVRPQHKSVVELRRFDCELDWCVRGAWWARPPKKNDAREDVGYAHRECIRRGLAGEIPCVFGESDREQIPAGCRESFAITPWAFLVIGVLSSAPSDQVDEGQEPRRGTARIW
jgi:hypothetical protein